MDFGEVLKKSWKIVWKFKVLWIFGILAGCGTGGGGSYYNNTYRTGTSGSGTTPTLPPGFESAMLKFFQWFANPAVIAVFISVIRIIVILSIFLGTIGQIGLIKGAMQADEGAERLTFGGLWKDSAPYFWRMFGLSLLIGIPLFIIVFVIAISFILMIMPLSRSGGGSGDTAVLILLPVLCALFCVVMLLSIVISFVAVQARNAIIIENQTIPGSLQRGWEVLTKNLGPILIVWVILLGIGLAAGIVIALPILIILVPIFISMMNSTGTFAVTPLIIAGLCIVAYTPISLVARGILLAYTQAVWTLTYLRLTKPKQEEQTPIALPANA